jgi:hypothetical protein
MLSTHLHRATPTAALPPRRGRRAPGAGRAAHIDPGSLYLGTTAQVAGLYPFMQGGALPLTGVPIGPHLLDHQLVCIDPTGWVGQLTTNPGIWISGDPGVGKSAVAKRLCLGLTGFGHTLVCPGDVKAEYAPLVRALGGQVVRVGRGLDKINPLDAGPVGRATAGTWNPTLAAQVNGRRAELCQALLATTYALGRRLNASEAAALNAAIRIAASRNPVDPTIPQVIAVLRDPPAEQLDRLMVPSEAAYTDTVRHAVAGLQNLCDGPLAGLFDGPTTTPLNLEAPAIAVDLSSLLTNGDHVVAAGLLATWSFTYQALDTARAAGLLPRPLVIPMDEMWRALRSGPGMVDSLDGLTRLNRSKGEITIMITHTLADLDALPEPADRAKAAGLMERCNTLLLAAQSPAELARVSAQRTLTLPEREVIASWASPTATGLDGTSQIHPGRGKLMLKIGTRIGIPVQLALTDAERRLYDTDRQIRAHVGGQLR